jgi:putative FmdB family regulatory protein
MLKRGRPPFARVETARCAVPIYEYTCQECKRDFVVVLSFRELEAKAAVTCPNCMSGKVERKYSGFTAVTSKKS